MEYFWCAEYFSIVIFVLIRCVRIFHCQPNAFVVFFFLSLSLSSDYSPAIEDSLATLITVNFIIYRFLFLMKKHLALEDLRVSVSLPLFPIRISFNQRFTRPTEILFKQKPNNKQWIKWWERERETRDKSINDSRIFRKCFAHPRRLQKKKTTNKRKYWRRHSGTQPSCAPSVIMIEIANSAHENNAEWKIEHPNKKALNTKKKDTRNEAQSPLSYQFEQIIIFTRSYTHTHTQRTIAEEKNTNKSAPRTFWLDSKTALAHSHTRTQNISDGGWWAPFAKS